LRRNLNNFINYLRTKFNVKKSYTQFVGLCWFLLNGLMNSRSFNGLQLLSDLCHHALIIFSTIIVTVCLSG
jgi:hypothetical protein